MKYFFASCIGLILFGVIGTPLHAQEIIADTEEIVKARVVEIVSQEEVILPGTNISSTNQVLEAIILEGENEGEQVTVQNDYVPLRDNATFFLRHITRGEDGVEFYNVADPNRLPALFFIIVLFVAVVFIFGGWQGIRGLLSLLGSFLVILYILLPGILQGISPLLLSIGVSSIIIIVGSYITHGFNKTTTSAVVGMICTVILTGILAYVSVVVTYLTGFESEEATYLNFSTDGNLDFVGLLLGGIMIGLLGVLYDVAIGQAISVEELHRIGPHLSRVTIYRRAIRIGREHIGALVNTLAIAYVGASLPLLLLFYASNAGALATMNREMFAVEIIRTMIGSIGLVLAVPITTFIAVLLLMREKPSMGEVDKKTIEEEERTIMSHHHTH